MSKINFQYAKGRFVNPKKIVDASIYSKKLPESDENGNHKTVIRVAISLDTENKDKSTVYSDPFETETQALKFIESIPEV